MAKINHINFRDVQALNGLRVCGYANREDLLKIITSNRIDKMLKQGLIESKTNIKNETVYTYTDKGKSFIKNLDSLKRRVAKDIKKISGVTIAVAPLSPFFTHFFHCIFHPLKQVVLFHQVC